MASTLCDSVSRTDSRKHLFCFDRRRFGRDEIRRSLEHQRRNAFIVDKAKCSDDASMTKRCFSSRTKQNLARDDDRPSANDEICGHLPTLMGRAWNGPAWKEGKERDRRRGAFVVGHRLPHSGLLCEAQVTDVLVVSSTLLPRPFSPNTHCDHQRPPKRPWRVSPG
jgi:hypothetical protein